MISVLTRAARRAALVTSSAIVAAFAVGCSSDAPPGANMTTGGTASSVAGNAGSSGSGVAAGAGGGSITAGAGTGGGANLGGTGSGAAGTAGSGNAGTGGSAGASGNAGAGGSAGTGGAPATLDPAVLTQMRKVADWQLPRAGASKDWIHGAMWTGIFATYELTHDDKYLAAIKTWAGPGWGLTGGAGARGDNQCAAQTFFDVYLLDPKPANQAMLDGAQPSFDAMLDENRSGRVEWWWEDALFMVPPGFVRLGVALNDDRYFAKMNTLYWDTYAFLWNADAGLMYRDDGLRGSFWARGNGWVIAGAVRVLQYLPQNDPKRPDFIKLLQQMSQALMAVQGDDGLWRSNLLNPNQFPNPETSGTGFFTYAMAWGINQGLLDKATYLPVVKKAWAGLNTYVDQDGKLGYVQPVGAGPAAATQGSTVEYGVGAFLLAGSEVAKLPPQ